MSSYPQSRIRAHHKDKLASERRYEDWKANGVLSDPEQVHQQVRAESAQCPHCGKWVHPDNWAKHFALYHPDEDMPALNTEPETQPETTPASLLKLDEVRQMLAQLEHVDEVKAIRDKAEAMRLYAKQAQMGLEAQNHAAEIKLYAERRAGELLKQMEKNEGSKGQLQGRDSSGGHTMLPPEKGVPTLADVGISKMQSSRWQAIADIPEAEFQQAIAETKAAQKELTSKQFQVAARKKKVQQRRHQAAQTPPPVGKYRTIVIDPPWPVEKIEREARPNQQRDLDYATMTLAEIAALPVPELAHDEGCHLYLWTTHKFLPDALALLGRWGFRYQCVLTWIKPTGMTPYSFMYNTELVLFARKGDLPLLRNGLKLHFEAPVQGHSVKPDVFYAERAAVASPEPRLDMFARQSREGFEAWGYEANGAAAS